MWYGKLVTQVARARVCRVSAAMPSFQGAGPQHLQKFWDPYLRPNGLTYSDEVWFDNTRGE